MNSLMQKITHDKSTILDDAIHFNIEMDPGIKNIIVPGEVRYQISSICNEAFTNITKYAKAKNVFVRITKESGSLKLLIRDDGIGFTPDEKTKNALTGSGYGLANMQRRASRVGGSFTLTSRPNEGTTIEAKFPLS
jgi:two-component system sensor histidine kinase UhpB